MKRTILLFLLLFLSAVALRRHTSESRGNTLERFFITTVPKIRRYFPHLLLRKGRGKSSKNNEGPCCYFRFNDRLIKDRSINDHSINEKRNDESYDLLPWHLQGKKEKKRIIEVHPQDFLDIAA